MTWLLTHTGRHFDVADPQPDMIDLNDIVVGLSNECRYAGQCLFFYSVAQHSELVSRIVPADYALEGLLHDAAEAYIKDIPRPLKELLPDYRQIEARVDAAIRARFGLPPTQSHAVKRADLVLLATERRDLMKDDGTPWDCLQGVTPLEKRIIAVNAGRAQQRFYRRLLEIMQGMV